MSYLAVRRGLSRVGRRILATAVSMNHDWGLPTSAEDLLAGMVADLSDEDLEAAYLLAHHLRSAIACVRIDRQMATDPQTRPDNDTTASAVDFHDDVFGM